MFFFPLQSAFCSIFMLKLWMPLKNMRSCCGDRTVTYLAYHQPHTIRKFESIYLKFIYWTCSAQIISIHRLIWTWTWTWTLFISKWPILGFLSIQAHENARYSPVKILRMLLMTWNGNEWVRAMVCVCVFFLAISWFHAPILFTNQN